MPSSPDAGRAGQGARRLALALALAAPSLGSSQTFQDQGLMRALQLEQDNKHREAAAAYRALLGSPNGRANLAPIVLGIERVYHELQWTDTLLVVMDSVIRTRPRDPLPRTVQLRALRMAGRDTEARAVFERWLRDAPRDPVPYREYARMLMQEGKALTADTVLRRAQQALGSGREFASEVAQLRAALGLWEPAARAWREAVITQSFMVQAAVFSLQPAPPEAREAVRATLRAQPAELGARRILASLELGWGSARDGWNALREVARGDPAAAAWREFAEQAELSEAWLTARDAFAAVVAFKPDPQLAVRAANAALSGGEPRSALDLTRRAAAGMDSAVAARTVLPVMVRALTELGQPTEAEQTVSRYRAWLAPDQRAQLVRLIAWGWVRAGDIARARESLRDAGAAGGDSLAGEDVAAGWIALYEGDLKTARTALRRAGETAPDLVAALAVLARTRAERAPVTGQAFLLLARGDSARAAAKFVEAARELADAAPLLLATAARVHAARRDDDRAVALWQVIVAEHAAAPEAAEADLEWARVLRRRGQGAAAIERLEHLILTYPQSALVPQARRELDLVRRSIPPASE